MSLAGLFISFIWIGGFGAMRKMKKPWFDSLIWPYHAGWWAVTLLLEGRELD